MNMYVVYDKLAQESGPVVECKNNAVAVRQFRLMIEKTGRPEEYQLLYLGKINHDTQEMELLPIPEEVVTGVPAMAVPGGQK